jgi:hypothetical protein
VTHEAHKLVAYRTRATSEAWCVIQLDQGAGRGGKGLHKGKKTSSKVASKYKKGTAYIYNRLLYHII